MRRHALVPLLLVWFLLAGCGEDDAPSSAPPRTSKPRASDPLDATVHRIDAALHDLKVALGAMRRDHPALAGIQGADVEILKDAPAANARTVRFLYEQGVKDSRRMKPRGPALLDDGGMIRIELVVLDPNAATEALASLEISAKRWQQYELPAGHRLASWHVVFGAKNDSGTRFQAQVSALVQKHLATLRAALGAQRVRAKGGK